MSDSGTPGTNLFELLPAIYRERDADEGGPLERLLGIVEGEAANLEADIGRLYDDLFAETCTPWVLPYIGDLVGNLPLFGADEVRGPDTAKARFPDLRGPSLAPGLGARRRADVVKTIYYRRRKGTPPMLEELARDVTGWATHLVEFFTVLGWTQMVRNHLRPQATWADLRQPATCELARGPFDPFLHSVDVRPIGRLDGWHAIRTLGFFVWRLGSFELAGADARKAAGDAFGWHVHPLGQAAPLFAAWGREGDEAGMTQERHVPGPIRKGALYTDLTTAHATVPVPATTDYYATPPADAAAATAPASLSITLWRGTTRWPVPTSAVFCADLSTFRQPSAGRVAVDPVLGRVALGTALAGQVGADADRVEVGYHYGFPAALGGGPYDRRAWTIRRDPLSGDVAAPLVLRVRKDGAGDHTTIGAALTAWAALVPPKPDAIIAIEDSRTYAESLSIEPADGSWLAIEAVSGARPHLLGDVTVTGKHDDAALTLSGLLIEGIVDIEGSLGRLRLLHTTLVPGPEILGTGPESGPAAIEPSLVAAPGTAADRLNERLEVDLAFSITGPLLIPVHSQALRLLDSVVVAERDADAIGTQAAPCPPTAMERTTVLGRTWVEAMLLASEAILEGALHANRRQLGCLRFSWVMPGSRTPRRYRCQPDLRVQVEVEALETASGMALTDIERHAVAERVQRWLLPSWTSRRYGQPAFAQLHESAPIEIREGAQDGAEMGAFCHLKQPQRVANLRQRLDEYLPFGLDAGTVPVT
ncbi:hypothetical protein AWB71_06073 [Caballeronia peredens]|nr:hypothetical protein AWB71_06073 [Caballeronia peredens]